MKIKSLLRFVLLLACLTIGVETYAEAEGTIEIQLINKKGNVFPITPGYDENTYILSSGTTTEHGFRILATAGEHPLELNPNSDKGGITVNFANTLLSLTDRQSDGSYYIVTGDYRLFDETNNTNTITFEYEGYTTRTINFEVDNTIIVDFTNYYVGPLENNIGVVGTNNGTIGISILDTRDGEAAVIQPSDYSVAYSSSNSDVAEVTDNYISFKKESTSVTLSAILTLNNNNYACPRGTYSDDFKVIAPASVTNSIGSGEYLATFSSIHNRDFSGTDIDVYIIKAINAQKAILTRVEDHIVNAGEGVLLYSASEKTDVVAPIAANRSSTSYTGNLLIATGAEERSVDGANDYILQNKKDGGLAFYKATGKKMKANRAYLQATAALARSLELNFDDETTGISEVSTDTDSQAVYYNLGGQRISQPRKGSIFVKNGKKIVR